MHSFGLMNPFPRSSHIHINTLQQLLSCLGGMSEDVENEMTESPERGGLCPKGGCIDVGRGGGMGGPPPADPVVVSVRVRAAIRSCTQPAESRASASWSQHSSMVETRLTIPWRTEHKLVGLTTIQH